MMTEDDIEIYICLDCLDQCIPEEETFSYSGTHCTHGQSGTHHTGHYTSDCCGAEFLTKDEIIDILGDRA